MVISGEMRVSVEGFDPIEREIARAIAKGMVEGGLNREKAEDVGELIAITISVYRRRMREPLPSEPPN